MTTGIGDFATQLHELKERSGLSYGTLATRLHVSTSTLHRYCNGGAVPGDYAPVERFARLCGASHEELLTLHRRWLLADAARRERSASAAEAEAVPAPAPDAAPAPAPEAAPEAAPLAESAARARRPRRRIAAVLAAAAALAVVAALALHSALADEGPAAGPRPTATATAAPTSTAPAPLQVSVLADNWNTPCDQWFLLAQQPAKVPPPPEVRQANGWADALGGTPAGKLRLELTVQGAPGRPVVLHTLSVRETGNRPAPRGIGYTTGSGCGGALTPASFDVDLDAAAPRTKAVPGFAGKDQARVVADFPFQVTASDAQVLDVAARTADRDVSWYLEILWSCGDRQGTLRVDDHGKPFRTVGLAGDPAYFYNGTAWEPTSVAAFS
ncbi:helix-turn-helix domain-containing protein [Actinacidiphila paucisporea]|uniref:Helix-turn-helix domain-containing protein n=1 Tax=Actinacidiphila paucisporea TaxID=310782 RepID=A0A1M7MVA8_9ACTN|nr:helix-turn-helix transcriptional regulator [Actinacidiphila paucisporea]SHM95071.1 Helix-turn-helix domain-containing protein [Actinacidiphila paucisporea]